MNKKTPIVVLVTLAVAGLLFTARGEDEPTIKSPRIVCDALVFDFGQADTGSIVEHTWILRNEGGQPLEITRVKAGCGCTAAKANEMVVQPGEQTELKASLSLVNRTGHQKKWVLVESNDPEQKALTLWFNGTAYQALRVVPERLYFGILGKTPVQSRTIKVTAGTGEHLNITGVETGTELLTAEVTAVKEGFAYTVELRSGEPPAQEDAKSVIKISTDHADHPVIEVPVDLSIGLGEVTVAPAKLLLTVNGDQAVTRQILVGAPGLEAFKVKMVRTPDPNIRFMISKLKPNQYRIQLKNIVPGPHLNGQVVRIETDLEGKAEILVPIEVK